MNNEIIKAACNALAVHVIKAKQDGRIPKFITVDGSLALMHDKISRFFNSRKPDEIMDLATDAVVLYIKTMLSDSDSSENQGRPEKPREENREYTEQDLGLTEEDIDDRWKPDPGKKPKKVKETKSDDSSS